MAAVSASVVAAFVVVAVVVVVCCYRYCYGEEVKAMYQGRVQNMCQEKTCDP